MRASVAAAEREAEEAALSVYSDVDPPPPGPGLPPAGDDLAGLPRVDVDAVKVSHAHPTPGAPGASLAGPRGAAAASTLMRSLRAVGCDCPPVAARDTWLQSRGAEGDPFEVASSFPLSGGL